MKNKIAIKIMLGLIVAVIIFHLCILTQIIRYEITWGGRLKSPQEMYIFECISIFINFLLGFVLLMKGGFIKRYFQRSILNIILWIFLLLFVLNTVANVFAETNFEKSFAILTLFSAILIGIILKNKPENIINGQAKKTKEKT